MDEPTTGIQDEIPWCMLFANNIILINENREGVHTPLERWRETLVAKGFRLSRSKIEYVHCQFSAGECGVADGVTIGGTVIPRIERFKYLARSFKKPERLMKTLTSKYR